MPPWRRVAETLVTHVGDGGRAGGSIPGIDRGLEGVRIRHLDTPRDPLLQQQLRGTDRRRGMEPSAEDVLQDGIGDRHEHHALVMRHPGRYDRVAPTGGKALRGVVQRLVEAPRPQRPLPLQTVQVGAGRARRDHERQSRRVRRHDVVAAQPALEPEPRDAERPVLIVQIQIQCVVGGLGDAPGSAVALRVPALDRDGPAAGLVEQGRRPRPQQQPRHEVFEEGAAPREEHTAVDRPGRGATEMEPVAHRHV